MTDHETQRAWRLIEAYRRDQRDCRECARRFDPGSPSHLEHLAQHVTARLSGSGIAEGDLRLLALLWALGPKDQGAPPAAVREELSARVNQFLPDETCRRERALEFVLAYGCGRWRNTQNSAEKRNGWDGVWGDAVAALARTAVEEPVREADAWLRDRVVGFPERSRAAREGDAALLALRLVRPVRALQRERGQPLTITCTDDDARVEGPGYAFMVPPGAKAVFELAWQATLIAPEGAPCALALPARAKVVVSMRDDRTEIGTTCSPPTALSKQTRLKVGESAQVLFGEAPATTSPAASGGALHVWSCTCGTARCAERHRLAAWEPTKTSLWAFVASAVKGPVLPIAGGGFVQGMYAALLAREGVER